MITIGLALLFGLAGVALGLLAHALYDRRQRARFIHRQRGPITRSVIERGKP